MPDSNPKAFARRLREAVENREPLDTDDLRAEAATDEVRAETYRRQAIVETALDAVRATPPEVDLADAVLAQLAADAPDTQPATLASATPTVRSRRGGWTIVVVAAAVLVAVLVLARPGRTPDDGSNGPIAGHQGGPVDDRPNAIDPLRDERPDEVVVDGSDGGDELDRLFAEATTAYRGLADETRFAVADLGFLIPSSEAAPVAPAAGDAANGWLDRVGDGLAPVRDNVGRTLDFLFEPVPADSTAT